MTAERDDFDMHDFDTHDVNAWQREKLAAGLRRMAPELNKTSCTDSLKESEARVLATWESFADDMRKCREGGREPSVQERSARASLACAERLSNAEIAKDLFREAFDLALTLSHEIRREILKKVFPRVSADLLYEWLSQHDDLDPLIWVECVVILRSRMDREQREQLADELTSQITRLPFEILAANWDHIKQEADLLYMWLSHNDELCPLTRAKYADLLRPRLNCEDRREMDFEIHKEISRYSRQELIAHWDGIRNVIVRTIKAELASTPLQESGNYFLDRDEVDDEDFNEEMVTQRFQTVMSHRVSSEDIENSILQRTKVFLWDQARRVHSHIRRSLTERLDAIMDHFEASSADVFTIDSEGMLQAEAICGVVKGAVRRGFQDKGIVSHVARTKQNHYSNNVREDRFYLCDDVDTKCEVATPILDMNGELLGVVNIESHAPAAFTQGMTRELEAMANAMVPDLLVYASLMRDDERWCPWHPALHGWDLRRFLNPFCDEVRNGISRYNSDLACWYADKPKKVTYIIGSSGGYGGEYKHRRNLPLQKSVVGKVWRGSSDEIHKLVPERDDFCRSGRMRRLSVKAGRSVKIEAIRADDNRHTPTLGVLNAYFRSEQDVHQDVEEALPIVARGIGNMTVSVEAQRRAMAVAMLDEILNTTPYLDETGMDPVREFLQTVFEADAVTILGKPLGQEFLYAVSTSGLARPNLPVDPKYQSHRFREDEDRSELPYEEKRVEFGKPLYDLSERKQEESQYRGMTHFQCMNPDIVIRKNDIWDPTEEGMPDGFPEIPRMEYVETFKQDCREKRRLLSMGVSWEGELRGVVRIIRSERSVPFTFCDELLLRDLSKLCARALVDWQRAVAFHSNTNTEKDDALTRPVCLVWKEHFLRPVARDYACHLAQRGLLKDIYWFLHRMKFPVMRVSHLARFDGDKDNADEIRVHGHYSDPELPPPDEEQLKATVSQLKKARLKYFDLFERQRMVTFTDDDGKQSHVWIPVTTWSESGIVQSVLAIDLSDHQAWRADQMEVLFAAACRFAAIWSTAQPLAEARRFWISRGTSTADFPNGFEELEARIRGVHEGLQECRVYLRDRSEWLPDSPSDEWQSLGGTNFEAIVPEQRQMGPINESADRLGVQQHRNGRLWKIPLHFGTECVGEVHCTRLPDEELASLIGTIYALWYSFALERDGEGRYLYDRLCFVDEPREPVLNDGYSPLCLREWSVSFKLNEQFRPNIQHISDDSKLSFDSVRPVG